MCCNNTVISSNLAISTEQPQVKNVSCNSYGITPETHKIPPISQKSVLQWFYICNWVAKRRFEILYRKLYTRERGDQRRALHGIPHASLEEQMPMGVPHLVKRTFTILETSFPCTIATKLTFEKLWVLWCWTVDAGGSSTLNNKLHVRFLKKLFRPLISYVPPL